MSVSEFYNKLNIFITGATGFVGIALIEKILRTLPEVQVIYILLRPKNGVGVDKRYENLKKNLVFENVKREFGNGIFNKIVPVTGDIGEDGLGLSEDDTKFLIENINIVFHLAAIVDFAATFKEAISINLMGTQRMVSLCLKMKKLKALIHVSSAYANADRGKYINEVLYELPCEADNIVNIVTSLSDEAIDEVTPKLLGSHQNSYTFTKALAEHEVALSIFKFPSAIVRPSIILGAWEEPFPGWTISNYGPQDFLLGAAKGILRRLPIRLDLTYDYIPVDIVVNHLICAGWEAGTTNPSKPLVLHCTSSTRNPFKWSSMASEINGMLKKYPLGTAIWYPKIKFQKTLLQFKISALFIHLIPAYIIDFAIFLLGDEPFLVRLHTKINKSLERLAPFMSREWFFDNRKALAIQQRLSKSDKKLFNLDIEELNWYNFFENLLCGLKQYVCKEDKKTATFATKKNFVLFIFYVLTQVIISVFIWWILCSSFELPLIDSLWMIAATHLVLNLL